MLSRPRRLTQKMRYTGQLRPDPHAPPPRPGVGLAFPKVHERHEKGVIIKRRATGLREAIRVSTPHTMCEKVPSPEQLLSEHRKDRGCPGRVSFTGVQGGGLHSLGESSKP